MSQSIRSLPESSLIKYLGQIFHVNMGGCPSFDEAIEYLNEAGINIPGLLVDDSTILIPDRVHLHASMYNLREGSNLFELLDAFIDDIYGGAYILMQDAAMAGKDGLFLLSVSRDEDTVQACNNNIGYMSQLWGKYGNPVANITTGGCKLKDGSVFSVVAVQLASINKQE